MLARIFSTLALWAVVALSVIFLKAYGFCLLIFLLSAFALAELCALFKKCGCEPLCGFAQASNFLILGVPVLMYALGMDFTASGSVVFALLIFALACASLKYPQGDFLTKRMLPTLLTIIFVPFFAQWLVLIALKFSFSEYSGIILAIWAIASAKFTDVGGYAVGMSFGRHKLSPNISPNKSWEGLLGGLISSAALSVLIVITLGKHLPDSFSVWKAALAALPIGLAGLMSDLFESMLKRRAGVKDSGALIPGIGGALDLADSMLLSAPIAYFILIFII